MPRTAIPFSLLLLPLSISLALPVMAAGEPAEASTGIELQPTYIRGSLGNALGETEGYRATHSSVATKTSMPLLETSQSVSVVTRKQMDDQGAQSVAQALRYTPGLMSSPYGATSRYDYVAMRGITDGSVDNLYLDGQKLLGDSATYSTLQVDPYFVERIDILKGPSSVLYGRSLPGGLVAMTSKKPGYDTHRQLQLSYGSHDYKQAAFDIGAPLDEGRRVNYRLVGVVRDAASQVDDIKSERFALMPSLAIDFTQDTRLTLLAMLQHDPEGGYHGGLPAQGTVTSHNGRRISRSFFEGDEDYEKFERHQYMLGYQLEHRFNDVVSARQNFQYLDSTVDSGQVYQYGYVPGTDNLDRYYTGADEALHAWSVDNQLQFEFATGELSHTLVTGLDYQRRKTKVAYDAGYGLAPIDPFTGAEGAATPVFYHQYDEARFLEQTGLYVQDLISLGNWRLSLGARQDWVDMDFEQTRSMYGNQADDARIDQFSGRIGLLYAFDNGLSPYASFSQSFNPNATGAYNETAPGVFDISLLDPTEGEQTEVGLKFQPPGTQDLYTIALFDLTQSNLANKDSGESFYRAVGEISSRGVELEARFKPIEPVNVLASYTWMDVEYSKDFTGTAGVNNRGNTPNAVAKNMASLWADYSFTSGPLASLQLGAGVRYFGKSWADAENTLRIPSYTLFDASVGYDLSQLGASGLGLRVNLNNLTDETYVAACNSLSQCYYGDERNVMATLTYDF
ncbi:TonB-dependent siderophore receptor [Pseudomonas sp. G11-1]|uniref:TonB-dependent siderophore receptor n=1 Tax=Halopseudomonas bauzanensis TaxID=653930 RepID=A0A4U0YHS7_9GAMM|nr:TonB-dependent siderophore receptor [Halopseudomonas bauzanensis]MCO5785060.1 TonB-dependent siderophore receptor [Pseudomonas sp. G11-1]MCO5788837.1 TonB-dependent siderophore receptor [Pseudomonas sp. G11-2]TKA90755.1 TonB-dependent siderophore receptor [Halopseudomonas bauzanensis]